MLYPRLNSVRERLDALTAGNAHTTAGLLTMAAALLGEDAEPRQLKLLEALDDELDRVGVHTSADAKLLRTLGVERGRAGQLATGLRKRAEHVLSEFEGELRRVERQAVRKASQPGAVSRLERAFARLARAVKVADLFSEPLPSALEPIEIFHRHSSASLEAPINPRLAIAEHWSMRAKRNVDDVPNKRRDLEAAHQLLLRIGTENDRERTRQARLDVADARERAKTTSPAKALRPLIRDLKTWAVHDPRRAYRAMRDLYERAVEAGDDPLALKAHEAAVSLLTDPDDARSQLEDADQHELDGWLGLRDEPGPDAALAELAFELDEQQLRMFELAAGCARYFDVENALADESVDEKAAGPKRRSRQVPYPTQTMSFAHTNRCDEYSNFVITQPGMLLYDLASNRQLVRTFWDDAEPEKPRRRRHDAVRVYVLDASGSMHGARARFRDAIFIAELNNLRLKAAKGLRFDPLYYSFFNDSPAELVRVDSSEAAARHLEKLFHQSPAQGQTDITLALVTAFESIRAAKGKDPHLARATVVLVTDGEDGVDLELIRRTRAPLGDVDIALSFISLGEENTDLKSLVLDQRERGARAFYHHLSDAEVATARSDFDSSWRTLLPRDVPENENALQSLAPHLEALEAIAESRDPHRPIAEGQFDALFPRASAAPDAPSSATAERVADLLEAIGEAAPLVSAEARAGECVSLLNHLLMVYQLSVRAYLETVSSPTSRVAQAMDHLRLTCGPLG